MRYYKLSLAVVVLAAVVAVAFSSSKSLASAPRHSNKAVSYFCGGKFANPFWSGHYVKVFVDVVDQTKVVGFNTDNGFLMDFPATGTYSNSGGIRSVDNFEGYDDINNYYWYTGTLIACS